VSAAALQRRVVAGAHGFAQALGCAGQLHEGLLRQRRAVHAQAQRRRKGRGPHRTGQEGDGVQQRVAPLPAWPQRAQPGQRGGVDARHPCGVRGLEQQREELGQAAGLGRARQHPRAQSLRELADEGGARGEAEVGEERGRVDAAAQPGQQALHTRPVLGMALQHMAELAQAQHGRGGGAVGWLGRARRPGRRVPQPLQQAHQPKMPFHCGRRRVGGVQQRRQVPGRVGSHRRRF
jgi:hypothetical protein